MAEREGQEVLDTPTAAPRAVTARLCHRTVGLGIPSRK
jgi:hypothetical protein